MRTLSRFTTLIRFLLSAYFIYRVKGESGFYTAASLALLFIAIETLTLLIKQIQTELEWAKTAVMLNQIE